MKFYSLIILTLITQIGWSQLNPNQINFGQLKQDLLNEPLTQQELESILNTFSSFGDKNVILEEVMKSFIIESNNEFSDSLINFWLNDFSQEDSLKLLKIPPIKKDFRERAFNMVFLSFFAKAYIDSISLIQAHQIIMQDMASNFPSLPEMTEYTGFIDAINKIYRHSKWYLSNPEEMLYFENLMKGYTKSVLGSYSETKLIEFVDVIKKDLKDRRSIYELYLPVPLSDYFNSQKKLDNSKKPLLESLDKQDIESFLKEAYYQVYNATIPTENLLQLKTYIEENNLYDAKVIYLALIFSKYE